MSFRLTGMTAHTMNSRTESIILKIGGQQKELTLFHVAIIMGLGWAFSVFAVICNVLYYAVYPSEVEFEWREKMKIFVFGTQRDFLNLFRCRCSCSSCKSCCQSEVKGSDEEQIALKWWIVPLKMFSFFLSSEKKIWKK